MNKISKLILISVLTLVFCCSIAVGSTYALLEDSAITQMQVSSGTVNVKASITRPGLYYDDGNGNTSRSWPKGGNVTLADNLGIVNMSPGCSLSFEVIVENSGTLATKWQVCIKSDIDVFDYVTFSVNDGDIEFEKTSNKIISTTWQRQEPPQVGKIAETLICVTIEYPYSTEETYLNGTIYVTVDAVHGNADTTFI